MRFTSLNIVVAKAFCKLLAYKVKEKCDMNIMAACLKYYSK